MARFSLQDDNSSQGFYGERMSPVPRETRPRSLRPRADAFSKLDLLQRQAWWGGLSQSARQQVLDECSEASVAAGACFSRYGEQRHHWYGILEGLLKWSIGTADGQTATLGGQLAGSWFGEATLLRGQPRKADLIALRFTRVLLMPKHTFDELRRTETGFNEFLLTLLAERIHWMMSNSAAQRLMDVDHMVARALVGITHPILNNHPLPEDGGEFFLSLSQEELAHLVAISRQRCNKALAALHALGFVRMEYGGLTIVDLAGLRRYTEACNL